MDISRLRKKDPVVKTEAPKAAAAVVTVETKPVAGGAKIEGSEFAGIIAAPKNEHPQIASWQQGVCPPGDKADYGFGFQQLKATIHGHELTLQYPKANDVPEIAFDPAATLESQLPIISKQMQALYESPKVNEMVTQALKKARISSPFDMDVVVDGKTINLTKAAPHSLTPDTLNKALVEIVKNRTFTNVRADVAAFYGVKAPPGSTVNVTGAKALETIKKVLAESVALAEKGFGPKLPTDPVRRKEYLEAVEIFAVKNLFHGENLVSKHVVQGFDVMNKNPDLNETLSHDIIDRASIAAVLTIDHDALKPLWARAWVLEEVQRQSPETYKRLVPGGEAPNEAAAKVDPEALAKEVAANPEWSVNPNAGEPRYLLFMYHWGDERTDADTLMNWHRAVDHHDGDLERGTLNLQQKRQNGVEHHAGTEHTGVRHEAGLGYDSNDLPFGRTIEKIWHDGAFKLPFWRVSAMKDIVFQRILQERGIITPEQIQVTTNPEKYLQLDESYQALQGGNSGADRALRRIAPHLGFAKGLVAEIDALSSAPQSLAASTKAIGDVFTKVKAAAAKAPTAEDGLRLLQYFQARGLQQAPRTVESVKAFMPFVDQARAEVAKSGLPKQQLPAILSGLTTDEAVQHRTRLEGLREAAAEVRQGGDAGVAAIYEVWNDLLRDGFPMNLHAR